jgi:hypothetical protein
VAAALHHKWMETAIKFDASDCPRSMAGAGQLPLIVSPTIANIKLYHVLIDGGVALNLIGLAAFKKLQISVSKLQPSRPFSGVGPVSVMLCTKGVLFDVAEVILPFNTILSRPILYQFMAVAHYGYLVLKMLAPKGFLKVHGDRDVAIFALEKLQAPAASREAAARPGGQESTPSSLPSATRPLHPTGSPPTMRESP